MVYILKGYIGESRIAIASNQININYAYTAKYQDTLELSVWIPFGETKGFQLWTYSVPAHASQDRRGDRSRTRCADIRTDLLKKSTYVGGGTHDEGHNTMTVRPSMNINTIEDT